ncbi:hypothetical protein [Streptoalloteichus hindustanus]|uniref:Uncharacterized protein n=1 Tax=Streptoalloteichus hindustanus TaxID=2017 RepID=A0A1M5P5T5_STRHI|nr:hypothetical protein [Streptoalloteichus hindustanus]SHG97132.1 hypothetical protein SAMN05444320_11780 [Streptoalloteichus hindustanus]
MVAQDLASYLWLLADGCGPMEAVTDAEHAPRPHAELVALAERHAPKARRPVAEVTAVATRELLVGGRGWKIAWHMCP